MVKKILWIATIALGLSVYLTDLASDSTLRSAVLPMITIVLLIVVLVVVFAMLFQKEHVRDYHTHASVEKEADRVAELPADAPRETTTTVRSTRTVTYIDGKKVADRYDEKRSEH